MCDTCFKHKIKTIQFGMVPGASRWSSSTTNYDPDTLPDFPDKEEVMDARSDFKRLPTKEMTLAEAGLKPTESGR